jgi:hypothetical protein
MMTSFYNLLKYAATGQASPDMTYYDRMRASTLMGGAIKTLTGVPPLSFTGNGKPLISWSMLGNGRQNGTPTPAAPIMPTFCGERTENIYNTQETVWIENTLDDDGNPTGSTTSHYTGNFTAVKPTTLYRISKIAGSTTSGHRIYYYDSDKNWIGRSVALAYNDYSFTTVSGCKYIQIQIGSTIVNTDNWMISEGISTVSFEPYGWKIPVTSAGQTVPVYLGQTQTTRRVKKLVLTGEESWQTSPASQGARRFYLQLENTQPSDITIGKKSMCTHFLLTSTGNTYNQNNSYTISSDLKIFFRKESDTTLNGWEQWLSEQYAARTPVVIWYVLAEPETGIANEPLCKIGYYADELHSADAGVSIPTTKGANTLTVETDLQPSSMTITYR